jgi:hypothetical protein
MGVVDQWTAIEQGLDPKWNDARLELHVTDEQQLRRAAALLAPAQPGRMGSALRFTTARRGGAFVGPEAVRRMMRRVDSERIDATLTLISSGEAAPEPVLSRASLAAEWDAATSVLPGDWSDLLCELELTSSDYIERAALLLSPLNPIQGTGRPGFRFRCARSFGYGASPDMVRRCLARCDEQRITGEVRILRALSDTHPVGTQGPVWRIGERAV